jgi:hypothetical protein
MTQFSPKLVDTPHYHLWTDALHGRALASQARNKWDRGTYIRWTVVTAWTVLEVGCQDALEDSKIGYRFKDDIDRAIKAKSLPGLQWDRGIWQKIRELQETRKGYIHSTISQAKLFPDAIEAEKAIEIVREGIKAIYKHVSKLFPIWIDDDKDCGWDYGGEPCNAYCIYPGASEDDPLSIKIVYVHKDREYLSILMPPGTDPAPLLDELIQNIRLPISAVRAYRGKELIEDRQVKMRGA